MDERKKQAEPDARRKAQGNPLLRTENQKNEEDQKKNVYKLRILTTILVLLIAALIAAFISEIGIYGKQSGRAAQGSVSVQNEQTQKKETDKARPSDQTDGSLAGL